MFSKPVARMAAAGKLCAVFAATVLAVLSGSRAADLELRPSQTLARQALPGAGHSYRLRLGARQCAILVVGQRDADFRVTAAGPASPQRLVDSFERGDEPLTVCADAAGVYRVEVRLAKDHEATAFYQLEYRSSTADSPECRSRIRAENLSTQARTDAQVPSAESLRAALVKLAEAARLWNGLHEASAELRTRMRWGEVHHALGEYDQARAMFHQCLASSREAGDRRVEADALNNLGMGYWQQGRTAEAFNALRESLRIWMTLELDSGRAAARSNLGIVHWQSGEWQQAVEHYLQAEQVLRAIRQRSGRAYIAHNLGVAHASLGQHDRALRALGEALDSFLELGERVAAARTLTTMARIRVLTGATAEARSDADQALNMVRDAGDPRALADAHDALGEALALTSDRDRAHIHHTRALELFRSVQDRRGEAGVLENLGLLEAAYGRAENALHFLHRALAIKEAALARDDQAALLYAIANVESGLGRLNEARLHLEQAIELTEALRVQAGGQQLRSSFLAARLAYYNAYTALLMRLHEARPGAGYSQLAFAASERTRARSLLDSLGPSRWRIPSGDGAIHAERQQALVREIAARSFRLSQMMRGPGTGQREQAARSEIEALIAEYALVEARIRAADPHYAALSSPRPIDFARVRAELDPDTLLLEYWLGEKQSFLWVLSRGRFESFPLEPRGKIEEAARSVIEKADGRRAPREALDRLARLVLGPARRLEAKRLAIVADGMLHYVPFAALPDPFSPGNPFLVQDHEIVMLPSASSLALLRDVAPSRGVPGKLLAVIADPVFEADDPRVAGRGMSLASSKGAARGAEESFARLPFARREAADILALVPEGDHTLIADFEACKDRAVEPELGRHRIIHFATHGVLSDDPPELSGLVLSLVDPAGKPRDGFLRLIEIYNLKLAADLVVLSACGTGLGRLIGGEGLIGLTRGFMYAGARRAVVSLWRVDDEATAELMKRFYAAMLGERRLSPPAALRAAQVEMLGTKRWFDPYYWAGFVFHGEWR